MGDYLLMVQTQSHLPDEQDTHVALPLWEAIENIFLLVLGFRLFSHSLGQNRKSSMRAHVFRFAPKSGHCATESAYAFRANTGSSLTFDQVVCIQRWSLSFGKSHAIKATIEQGFALCSESVETSTG
jgi:hypothetical protein